MWSGDQKDARPRSPPDHDSTFRRGPTFAPPLSSFLCSLFAAVAAAAGGARRTRKHASVTGALRESTHTGQIISLDAKKSPFGRSLAPQWLSAMPFISPFYSRAAAAAPSCPFSSFVVF
jgi:hypothetical protein